jgi:uncharacterized membrane protein HdeD (DUF308 family)
MSSSEGTIVVQSSVNADSSMRIALRILGAMLIIAGLIFFLQGINVLPGSFMTGQTKWVVYGAVILIAGVIVIVFSRR